MPTDFLFELGVEEMPPSTLVALSTSLEQGIREGLGAADIAFEHIQAFATPRRLAVLAQGVADQAPDRRIERRGPPVNQAFDEHGAPRQSALAFAKSCGVAVEALSRQKTDKGEWLSFAGTEAGAQTRSALPRIVTQAVDGLPIARRMRWGAGDVEFVRPVHWVVLLWGTEVLDAQILGLRTGRETRGHRFHAPEPCMVGKPADYEALQKSLRVIASTDARREVIRAEVQRAADRIESAAAPLRPLIDETLLDEVTALVEWPVAIAGRFDAKFLGLPREVVISTVQHHQRYFPLEDAEGRLTEWFITISNIESLDPSKVRAGNERVVRPRLEDAMFFWSQDRKQTLAQRATQLERVTFQAKLGSYADKTRRIEQLAQRIAEPLGASPFVAQAAQLAKADLLTDMVGEFPELQGTVGRHYAQDEGLPSEVAIALEEQYRPRFATDTLPRTPTGRALALADRLDTLAGIFSIDARPTGTKDPYALRRAALGVLRIMRDARLDLDLGELLTAACELQPVQRPAARNELLQFVLERLRGMYADGPERVGGEMLDAVLAVGSHSPLDIDQRLRALQDFLLLPQGAVLIAANKRISNLLKKSTLPADAHIVAGNLKAPAERSLQCALEEVRPPFAAAIQARDYGRAMQLLTNLRTGIDEFFEGVMVMDSDAVVRTNRLVLLRNVQTLFLQIADLSRLAG